MASFVHPRAEFGEESPLICLFGFTVFFLLVELLSSNFLDLRTCNYICGRYKVTSYAKNLSQVLNLVKNTLSEYFRMAKCNIDIFAFFSDHFILKLLFESLVIPLAWDFGLCVFCLPAKVFSCPLTVWK